MAGVTACGLRVWYTSGTQIARMDPYSNPIAVVEDPYVRALSYALVHGMYPRSELAQYFSVMPYIFKAACDSNMLFISCWCLCLFLLRFGVVIIQ